MQVKIDLITGLLGSGKTTFIIRYVQKFLHEGKRVCILANDYGAISVDRALLTEALGDRCDIEMVTAGDWDCYRRRFRTKLISMGMLGYDRAIVEPSGIFDMDDFFNILNDSPIDRWYSLGNILCMVDAHLPGDPDDTWKYLFTSEAANAGLLVVSRAQEIPGFPSAESSEKLCQRILSLAQEGASQYRCGRAFRKEDILVTDWSQLTQDDWERILNAGYRRGDMQKLPVAENGSYQTLFYYRISRPAADVRTIVKELLTDGEKYGKVIRVKGFFHAAAEKRQDTLAAEPDEKNQDTVTAEPDEKDRHTDAAETDESWLEINATAENIEIKPTAFRKEVLIVVGEHLNSKEVGLAFGETRSVTYYDV